MQDLRSQLVAKLGATLPPEDAADDPVTVSDPLGPSGHLDSPWVCMLRELLPLGGVAPMPPDAKLARCQQVTAQVVKLLKKSGRAADARTLAKLRDEYVARRAKVAWARVKRRFSELGASEKAYRSLKQGNADPERILRNMDRMDREMFEGAGARRLRELLLR
ncbi:MAG: hypothetical protein VX265_11875 [Myxococcota bacterium]|nr:hypothetical protein [Myxococcota bacterium]